MIVRGSLLLLVGLATLTAPELPGQRAPIGYRTFGNDLAPIRFFYPRVYQELPLPPTEKVMIARYVQRKAPRELSREEQKRYKGREAEVYAFYFEEAPVTTPREEEKKGGESGGSETSGPRSTREAMEAASLVSNFTEFKERRLRSFRVEAVKGKEGHYELSYPKNRPKDKAVRLGYLVLEREGKHVMGVFGHTVPSHFERQRRELIKMTWGLKLSGGHKKDYHEDRLDRLYANKDYKGIERRKKVRRELAKGWKVLDTENYILVYNTRDMGLVNKIARDIEAMRKVYESIFAPSNKIDAVSIVRVCRNKSEYHQYGGPRGTGGYWHPGNEELVFFDYDQEQRDRAQEESSRNERESQRRLTDKDSYLVLYHEALHQYVHYAVGEFRPHDWFNEGFGDYFSGAIIPSRGRSVRRIGPSRWRIQLAKNQCEFGHGFVPLKKLLHAERGQFYHPARRGLYYAAAWSFIYFMQNSAEVEKHPRWSKLLMTYFESIKKHYAAGLAQLSEAPTLKDKHAISARARVAALKDAIEGIDLSKLERVWRDYIVEMKNPWPAERVIPEKFKDERKR